MNNEIDNNQHYITESFVKKRFGTDGFVQRYDIKHDWWKTNASPQFVFSSAGYTQLLAEGEPVDNSLEANFSELERNLKDIFPALDDAATRPETKLPEAIYWNLCRYCAYLWYLSPFAKAKAPADMVMTIEANLKNGNWKYLLTLGIPEDTAKAMLTEHQKGYRFILQGGNYHQWAFRVQFIQGCIERAKLYRFNTRWTVYNSPIELPISDIAVIDMAFDAVVLFILPISPNLVLIGKVKKGTSPCSSETIIYGDTLKADEAQEILEYICLSGVKVIACKNRMDIKAIREQAKQRKVEFTRISNLDDALSAGSKIFDIKNFRFAPVNQEDYVKYVHSFIKPPETWTNEDQIAHHLS